MGSIYKRGNVRWIAYYKNGKLYRESTGLESEREARRILKLREGEVASGRFSGLRPQRIRFGELAQGLVNDYRVNGRKSLDRAERSIRHLEEFFGGMRAIEITTDYVKAYIAERKEEGASNATINRELSALKRMFSLAKKETPPKVINVPYIPHLEENNARQGYLEHDEFLAVRKNLPEHLKTAMTMAYYTGMRKGEILGLRWEQVDIERGMIKLESQDTKNAEPRIIPMSEEVRQAVAEHWEKHMKEDPLCPWVFTWRGKRVQDFEKAWATACRKAEVNRLFHDLRRTAVRNMVRAGIPEVVAMKISGHKTRSIFDRYNIVNEEDLVKAAEKLSDYLYTNIHNSFTIGDFEDEGKELTN